MKLLVLSDIHGNLDAVARITGEHGDVDAILIGGDVTDFGGYSQAEAVISVLKESCDIVFAVPGNCDPADAERALDDGGLSVHRKIVTFHEYGVMGVGGVSGCHVDHEDGSIVSPFKDIAESVVSQADDTSALILITHQPAWHTKVDRSLLGRHSGNRAIREFIETYQPVLAVSGHIHEAAAVDTIGSTVLINPGPCRKGYFGIVTIGPNKQVDAVLHRN